MSCVLQVSRLKLYLPKEKWTMNEIHFFQNTSCAQKISRLKLYLPGQKWTMKETLIFIKIRHVLKMYRDWYCIFLEKNEHWMKFLFFSKYGQCPNCNKTEAIFTKSEMNNERNVHFPQNTSCVQKVSKLKMYLPKQKWIMNETYPVRPV